MMYIAISFSQLWHLKQTCNGHEKWRFLESFMTFGIVRGWNLNEFPVWEGLKENFDKRFEFRCVTTSNYFMSLVLRYSSSSFQLIRNHLCDLLQSSKWISIDIIICSQLFHFVINFGRIAVGFGHCFHCCRCTRSGLQKWARHRSPEDGKQKLDVE